jgi:peroxiredoxin
MKRLLPALSWLCASALLPSFSQAQEVAPPFSGTTLDGKTFDLAQQRGRVVLLLLWRTDCPVCLSAMRELRANALGWKDAPFDLAIVNLDVRSADAEAYDRARRQVAASEGPVLSFWQGYARMPEALRNTAKVPLTLVIDRDGKVAARHEGRLPPELWNQVADLLP